MEDYCQLCPRKCRVNRENGERGFCGETSQMRIGRAALHMWEEPCISGEEGSGAIFFSGCNLRCCFCQNHQLSSEGIGREISVEQLCDIMLELQEKGANNINLVTPTHFRIGITKALKLAKINGLSIPVVYNTGGYETTDSIKALEGMVDIYLPDYKYVSSVLANNFSAAADYPETAVSAIHEMVDQVGTPQFDKRGMMIKGVIVRHLVLPGHTKESIKVLGYLHRLFEEKIYISIMSQYTPVCKNNKYTELNRKLTKREYKKVLDFAIEEEITNAFIQEGDVAKESFIPMFES